MENLFSSSSETFFHFPSVHQRINTQSDPTMTLRLFTKAFILLFLALPLHLLSTSIRFLHGSRTTRVRMPSSFTVFLVFILLCFLSILAFSGSDPISVKSEVSPLSSELEQFKLKLADLESTLQDNTDILSSKVNQLGQNRQLIEELERKIHFLKETMQKMKKSPSGASYADVRISDLEEEISHLWAQSRKNNFDIHILEVKASDAEKKLEAMASKVHKMEGIVSEQWIQIRQIEQALELTKIRASKTTARKRSIKFTLSKFMSDLHQHHLPEAIDLLNSCFSKNTKLTSKSFLWKLKHYLRTFLSKLQGYHHELQHSVKHALESNEYTANFANKEIVFFLVSAAIVFPIVITFQLIKGPN